VGAGARRGLATAPHLNETMKQGISRWLTDDEGQDLVEYILLSAFIGVVSIVVMNNFGNIINVVYQSWDTGTQAIWQPQNPQP